MHKILFNFIAMAVFSFGTHQMAAQAFSGKDDNKLQIGPNFQDNGTGIEVSYNYGIGQNLSIGAWSSYVLGINDTMDASFGERFDLRARLNANLGNVIADGKDFDVYPGLSLGLRNFGGHVGARYFFSSGFGIYTEFSGPIARYKTDALSPAEELLNQFLFSIGASFNL